MFIKWDVSYFPWHSFESLWTIDESLSRFWISGLCDFYFEGNLWEPFPSRSAEKRAFVELLFVF